MTCIFTFRPTLKGGRDRSVGKPMSTVLPFRRPTDLQIHVESGLPAEAVIDGEIRMSMDEPVEVKPQAQPAMPQRGKWRKRVSVALRERPDMSMVLEGR